ncbi:MAG: 50S ribosomal protein L29 [Phycisphaerae bacterium]|nr:50S ribosomal protein L29 [Phycisphaerae bacterium]
MKAEEVHQLSDEEIRIEVDRLRRHLYDLKAQAVTEKLEDPTQLGIARRDIARLLTEQSSRAKRTAAETTS